MSYHFLQMYKWCFPFSHLFLRWKVVYFIVRLTTPFFKCAKIKKKKSKWNFDRTNFKIKQDQNVEASFFDRIVPLEQHGKFFSSFFYQIYQAALWLRQKSEKRNFDQTRLKMKSNSMFRKEFSDHIVLISYEHRTNRKVIEKKIIITTMIFYPLFCKFH